MIFDLLLDGCTNPNYNLAGNLKSRTRPDGKKVSYEYDLNDRLVKVTDGKLVTTYTYDAAGRVTETLRPNGSVYEYNEKDEIVRLENRSNDDKVESLHHSQVNGHIF